jgi:hypothetical protein
MWDFMSKHEVRMSGHKVRHLNPDALELRAGISGVIMLLEGRKICL